MREMIATYDAEAKRMGLAMEPKVWGLVETMKLIKTIDEELAELFDRLNIKYATLHSDIFRLAALYHFGGIYHDAKCWLRGGRLRNVLSALNGSALVFEERGSHDGIRRVRATNMAAKRPGLHFFRDALDVTKTKLRNYYDRDVTADHHVIFDVGSHSILDKIGKHMEGHRPRGHLTVGYRCTNHTHHYNQKRPTKSCTDAPVLRGSFHEYNESFAVLTWGTTCETSIAAAYNTGGHWSKVIAPLFLCPSADGALRKKG